MQEVGHGDGYSLRPHRLPRWCEAIAVLILQREGSSGRNCRGVVHELGLTSRALRPDVTWLAAFPARPLVTWDFTLGAVFRQVLVRATVHALPIALSSSSVSRSWSSSGTRVILCSWVDLAVFPG